MSDWYTGSATVLIKALVHSFFGIQPNLDGVNIKIPNYLPSNNMSLKLKIKNIPFCITYEKRKNGTRKIFINGQEIQNQTNIFLNNDFFNRNTIVDIAIIN